MLSKLAYLTLCRSIQLLALAARSDAVKDLEIVVLRHQLAVLRRQIPRPRLEPADRALLATVSRVLPRARWSCLFVQPETLLRWHRLGVRGSATAIRTTLRRHRLDPAPRRASKSWPAFLRQQAAGIVACDLLHLQPFRSIGFPAVEERCDLCPPASYEGELGGETGWDGCRRDVAQNSQEGRPAVIPLVSELAGGLHRRSGGVPRGPVKECCVKRTEPFDCECDRLGDGCPPLGGRHQL